ncbi:MAG: response regulator [Chloroflexi bacterium]|nr:response regulator [Chloroflexota bacterium]
MRATTSIVEMKHILVIDDEEPICRLFSGFFRRRGYQVSTAGTAEEALTVLKLNSVDLVLLDLGLPDLDGLDLLTILKIDYPDLPVVMMSGQIIDKEFLREMAQRKGAGYVNKPVNLNHLLREVQWTISTCKTAAYAAA